MNPDEPAVLTLRETAEMLKVHPCTIYRLIRRQKLPAFKLGSDWRFNREQLDKWRLELPTATTNGSKGKHARTVDGAQ
jgi:excisionase family DNA binding protein